MNILNKLTIKNLKLNKKRTIVTIIGIILSTALICAVAGMITSFQGTLIENAKKTDGNYHISFKDVPNEELKYIENNREVKAFYLIQNLGYAPLKEIKNEDKPYIYVRAYDKHALINNAVNLTEGRLPKNKNEIILTKELIDDMKYKIGDKLKLNISEGRFDNGSILTQNNYYINNYDEDKPIFEQLFEREYEIVGIMEKPNTKIESWNSIGYTGITYMEELEKDETDISVLYKDVFKYKDATFEINSSGNKDFPYKYDYTKNGELLRWSGADINESGITFLLVVGSIVILIIIVTSIFVIRNSFSISVTERFKQYGMLSSVGATRKQIKHNVLFEGLIYGLIGIPIGILCGMLAIYILIMVINLILGDFLNGIEFIYRVPFLPILLSIILGFITILLSSLIPAKRASKISPIEAIRGNNDIKIKSKKLKTPKIIKKIFKIGGDISYKNLKRSKKKYRTTVISLVVSISTFIGLSSFIDLGFNLSNVYYKEIGYNVIVTSNSDSYEKYERISKLNNIDKFSINTSIVMNIDPSNILTDEAKSLGEMESQVSIELIGISDNAYNDYLQKLGVKNSGNKAILIDDNITYINDKKHQFNVYTLKPGDKLKATTLDDKKEIEIEILARTDIRPMGLEQSYSTTGYLIVPESYIEKLENYHIDAIYIKSNNSKELSKQLDELFKAEEFNDFHYTDYDEMVRANNALVLIISIFLYGFITVITLIGVTNIFNTITTNMNLRSKEFAMLKSIGMTKKEFNKMIRLESLFYGIKSLLFGIPIGIILSYLLFKGFEIELETGYILPIKSIIISIIFVFIIVSLTMRYSLRKINKQNIIETIRNDNI
ncbi:MAG: ABC transporter permease [Clostridium sp.]|nr:ABC transporter permease [Clostridium sp.]MCM1444418.1 ABC transporter permease [Candidatus Amulumruptor caecigallinarius]